MNKSIIELLEQRYFFDYKFEDGSKLTEDTSMMFLRVAKKAASTFFIKPFHKGNDATSLELANKYATKFKEAMMLGNFIPSSPQLMNVLRMFGMVSVSFDKKEDGTTHQEIIYSKEKIEMLYKPIHEMTIGNWRELAEYVNSKSAYGSCYAMRKIKDDLPSIYKSLSEQAEIFRAAGGYGTSFSDLRNEGSLVKSTLGTSCGPLGYMELFNTNTQLIALNGKTKRGANMFSLSVRHPDIEKFITAKNDLIEEQNNKGGMELVPRYLRYANISVEITDDFIEAVKQDKDWDLIDPSTGVVVKTVKAANLMYKIAYSNWATGEPGLLMLDNINRFNPFVGNLERIETSNPCGEFVSFPETVCNLASVNFYNMYTDKEQNAKGLSAKSNYIDFKKLQETVSLATLYLNLISFANVYPTENLTKRARDFRPIGLGFMGLASLLMRLGMSYGSLQAKYLTTELVENFMYYIIKESHNVANNPFFGIGSFINYEKTYYNKGEFYFENDLYNRDIQKLLKEGIANSRLSAIAPTGSISQICAGLFSHSSTMSGGLEPIFSLSYNRTVNAGRENEYVITQDDVCIYDILTQEKGFSKEQALEIISNIGTDKQHELFNESRFKTAMKLSTSEHVEMVKIISDRIDMSASKTINLPYETTVDELVKFYTELYESGIKGITVFRSGSRTGILEAKEETSTKAIENMISEIEEHPGESKMKTNIIKTTKGYLINKETGKHLCPKCKADEDNGFVFASGCAYCSKCGWSAGCSE